MNKTKFFDTDLKCIYIRITKAQAFKEFNDGHCIRVAPCKVDPTDTVYNNPFDKDYCIYDITPALDAKEDYKLELQYASRKCNRCKGYYLSYYKIIYR